MWMSPKEIIFIALWLFAPATAGRSQPAGDKYIIAAMTDAEQMAFVLVRTRSAGNIGAAARALKNMGFADLRLVAPAAGEDRVASEMAVHGRDVLARARRYPDLAAALEDRTLALGTTCRLGGERVQAGPLREVAAQLSALAAERIAIVFGPEDHGLSNYELSFCQRLIVIPTAPEYPSLNLAQAVMLTAWELFMARGDSGAPQADCAPPALAPWPESAAMLARLERALIAIGFLPADHPEHIMASLRALFGRAGLSPHEVAILSGIAHQVNWFAQGGRETIERKQRAGRAIR